MTPEAIVQQEIRDLCAAFRDGLQVSLGSMLYGVYLYGAVVFPGPAPLGDIDFHVILGRSLTGAERADLAQLHDSLAQDHPPLGAELDGYYLLIDDARQPSPPRSQMWAGATDNSWALHRQHILAGRCIVLHGPDPKTVYPAPSWSELEEALFGELQYVEDHLADYPAYCILNLCRLLYSFETRDVVVSKAGSAAWASESFPEWQDLIDLAQRSYAGQAAPADEQTMLEHVERLYLFACRRIDTSQAGWKTGLARPNRSAP